MKRFFVILFLMACGYGLAQTVPSFTSQINATFPDNTVGSITPANVRSYEQQLVNLLGAKQDYPATTQSVGNNSVAVATTAFVQQNTLPSVGVTAFGAKCDSSTDDTTAFQAAINAVSTQGGGIVSIPPSVSCVIGGSPLSITSSGVYLEGTGANSSTILISSVRSTDVIQFGGSIIFGGVRRLNIKFTATPTAGAAINLGDGSNNGAVDVDNVYIAGAYNGININQGTGGTTRIVDVDFNNIVNDGIQINGTNSALINNTTHFQNVAGGGAGVHIINGQGIQIHGGFFDGYTNGIYINPNTGDKVIDVWMSNLDLDSSTNSGLTIDSSAGTGQARDILLTNVRAGFANNGSFTVGYGMVFNGAGTQGINVVGGEIVKNTQEGILISGGQNYSFTGVNVFSNSVAGSNSYPGVSIAGGDHIQFTGGRNGQYTDGSGNSQSYGISITSAFTGNLQVTGMDLKTAGNDGAFANAGSGTFMHAGNYGLSSPSITACSSGSVVAGSTDERGVLSLSGATETCGITFSTTESVTSCTATFTGSTFTTIFAISSSGVTFGLGASESSGEIFYHCDIG